jgi:hypothetical protein
MLLADAYLHNPLHANISLVPWLLPSHPSPTSPTTVPLAGYITTFSPPVTTHPNWRFRQFGCVPASPGDFVLFGKRWVNTGRREVAGSIAASVCFREKQKKNRKKMSGVFVNRAQRAPCLPWCIEKNVAHNLLAYLVKSSLP